MRVSLSPLLSVKRTRFLIITLSLIVASCLFTAGWEASALHHRATGGHGFRKVQASGYRFTSPLLDVELPEGLTSNLEPVPFKYKIEDFVRHETDGVMVRTVAVYYRDLHDGPWFGINEDREFDPASMMKVPVMIAWLKRAERSPGVLSEKFTYTGEVDRTIIQDLRPRVTLQKGKSYTVSELLLFMMKYSDNNATGKLYRNLKTKELNSVLDGMDINNHPAGGHNSISVHGYSGFFRILYNAAYLNREMSEKALQLLSEEDFPQGIAAGVPPGTKVAGKFGEMEDGPGGEHKELHEFGIVYGPKGHYILGVMTEGSSFERQAKIIRDVSSLFYENVNGSPNLHELRPAVANFSSPM